MGEILGKVWLAVRPVTAQLRFLWWCGTLLLVSGAVHAVLLVWSLIRFDGGPVARIAVVVGLLAILASGGMGYSMAAQGEAVVEATGQAPSTMVFGAAGSAKLAHAVGMHGLQLLGLLAIGLCLGLRPLPRRTQVWLMGLAATGYVAVFAAVAATAYAGRAWTSPSAPLALLTAAGVLAVLGVCAVAARPLLAATGQRRVSVMK